MDVVRSVLSPIGRLLKPLDDWLFANPRSLPRWAMASLVANTGIILTGALVRLTGSGLGCPTWPKCTAESYVPHGAISHHSLIEFGNRTLTFVLMVVAVTAFVAARRHGTRSHRRLTLITGIGIPFQGVIGGITVLTGLNPFVVALHLLLSLTLLVLLTRLVMSTWQAPTDQVVGAGRNLATIAFVGISVACWLGTVVTGSGPHSGDGGAVRTGFDIELVARIHAASVWVTLFATLSCLVVLRRDGHRHAARWAMLLLAVILSQGVVGYVQYFTGVPVGLVLLHMLGAAAAVIAGSALLFGVRGLPAASRHHS